MVNLAWEIPLTRAVTLPAEPTEDHYEHLAAAFLAAGGYFIEKNIRERVKRCDFQELDVCGWRWADGGGSTAPEHVRFRPPESSGPT